MLQREKQRPKVEMQDVVGWAGSRGAERRQTWKFPMEKKVGEIV